MIELPKWGYLKLKPKKFFIIISSNNNRKRGFNHMKIILLIDEIINTFNENFKENLNLFNLESKIKHVGNDFTLELYEHF